ncbi:MAG: amidohydrolase [Eubacteriales bacterium]|nr:amidohydrolase [Eubacteriales bacterium]
MNIRFYNARILTMEEGRALFEGELWTKDERIAYVGPAKTEEELKQAPAWDREIDCRGNVLMPGFKDAHTHSGMTAMRSFADDMPLQEWLNTKIFPLEAKMTEQDNYDLTQLAILEYLTSGITAIFDMYLSPKDIAQACIDMGMRCALVSGLNKFGPTVQVMEERYNTLNRLHPLITYQMGVHAEYTCDRGLLEDVSALIHQYQAPLYAHMSETRLETDECIGRYGMTPPAFFDSLGLFDFGGGVYHAVHFTEEDMDLFAKKGLHIVTNPGSNTKLASGIAPVGRFLEKGINVAIGTDGPSSNNCLDMFREMFLTTGLAKLLQKDAGAVDGMEVLRMATANGARAMLLPDTDVLAAGKLADLIMIDLHQPNMQPLNNIAKNIVYSGSKQNVKLTMINGKILYENGEYLNGVDAEAIYDRANRIIRRLAAEV